MPIKFLSDLLTNLRSRLPNQQSKPSTEWDDYGINLNYIPDSHKININDTLQERVNLTLVLLSIGLVFVFAILVLINFSLEKTLQQKLQTQSNLVAKMEEYNPVAMEAYGVAGKTDYYKSLVANKINLSEKTDLVFKNASLVKAIPFATITSTRFNISIEVTRAIDFAHLISKYMESGKVNQVSIMSAEYQVADGSFKVVLEGTY